MKTCFKCNQSLPITEFYPHKDMTDGHLSKCKACVRKDVAERVRLKKATDPAWVLAERERCRKKTAKARSEGRIENSDHNAATKRYNAKFPEKAAAHNLVASAIRCGRLHRQPCVVCGAWAEAHHDDYFKPLEVVWLCPVHHKERHVALRDGEVTARLP